MIESNEYFMNNVRSNQYSLRQNLIKLNEPVNKTLWGMTPSTGFFCAFHFFCNKIKRLILVDS